MKKALWTLCLWAVCVWTAFGSTVAYADSVATLENRLWEAGQVLDEIMISPDQSIPEELLAKCKAIAIYPSVLKGGFILGARYGKGVVVKKDEVTGQWGAPAFSTIGGGSYGLQIGGSSTDLILVIMNERGMRSLLENNFKMGADAAAVAGPVGRTSEASTDLYMKAGMYAYSRSKGLFAGVALDGAVLTQDNDSNSLYYERSLTSRDILLGKSVQPKASSKELLRKLTEYSKRWKGPKY